MARIRLTPQKRRFFDLFAEASANVVETARLLVELLSTHPRDGALTRRIRELEHLGDGLTHDLIDLLNRTFVTPFDREDIYRLAGALDDVVDHIDEAADDIELYGVQAVPEKAKAQADVILRAAVELDEAVRRLDGFRDAGPQLEELRRLEDEGDRLVRAAVADLFRSAEEPLSVIRWKDIHERLEEAVDAVENASDVLEAILVKNR